jgi:hypothetical protein
MILAAASCVLRVPPASAGAPEPLDAEFLDYLLAYEGKDHNWTVVAKEKPVKKPVKAEVEAKGKEDAAAPPKVKEEPKP